MNIDALAHILQSVYEAKCQITPNDVIKLTENYMDCLPVYLKLSGQQKSDYLQICVCVRMLVQHNSTRSVALPPVYVTS